MTCYFQFTRIDMHIGEHPYVAVKNYRNGYWILRNFVWSPMFIPDDLPF
jgi:hypothetical protein